MVHQKAAPKRKAPSTKVFYGHHAATKKAKTNPNYRTGGYLGNGTRTGGFVGIEHKFLDTDFIGQVDNVLANAVHEDVTALCLNGVGIGNAENQRIGRKIMVTSLEINGYYEIRLETAPEEAANVFTIWIVKDKQTNRIQMSSLEYLKGGAPTSQAPNTFLNLQWRDRFETLYKRTFHISANSYDADTATFASTQIPFHINIPLACPTLFNTQGVNATVSSISDNSLHFLVIANRANTGGHANLHYQSRIRFTDM